MDFDFDLDHAAAYGWQASELQMDNAQADSTNQPKQQSSLGHLAPGTNFFMPNTHQNTYSRQLSAASHVYPPYSYSIGTLMPTPFPVQMPAPAMQMQMPTPMPMQMQMPMQTPIQMQMQIPMQTPMQMQMPIAVQTPTQNADLNQQDNGNPHQALADGVQPQYQSSPTGPMMHPIPAFATQPYFQQQSAFTPGLLAHNPTGPQSSVHAMTQGFQNLMGTQTPMDTANSHSSPLAPHIVQPLNEFQALSSPMAIGTPGKSSGPNPTSLLQPADISAFRPDAYNPLAKLTVTDAPSTTQATTVHMGLGSLASTYLPNFPKEIIGIRDQPASRTMPNPKPTFPAPKLKLATDPPTSTGYPGGLMKPTDFNEYISSMVFLGKPVSDVRERMPIALRNAEGVPRFHGDPNDIQAVREHLNTVTDWGNRFVRASICGYDRLETEIGKLKDQIENYEMEKRHVDEMIETGGGNAEAPASDTIRHLIGKGAKLEADIKVLQMHHRKCKESKRELGTHPDLLPKDRSIVGEYQTILARKDQEIRVRQTGLSQKIGIVDKLQAEVLMCKQMVAQYQAHIREWVNRNNFVEVWRKQLAQKLAVAQQKNKDLAAKYMELFGQATQLSSENQGLRKMTGWVTESTPPGEGVMPNITFEELFAKYELLYQTSRCMLLENKRLEGLLRTTAGTEVPDRGGDRDSEAGEVEPMQGIVEGTTVAEAEPRATNGAYQRVLQEKEALELKLAEQQRAMEEVESEQANQQTATELSLEAAQDYQSLVTEIEELKKKYREQLELNEGLATSSQKLNDLHLAKDLELEAMRRRLDAGKSLSQQPANNNNKKKNGKKKKGQGNKQAAAPTSASGVPGDADAEPHSEKCLMTLDELTSIMSDEGFKDQMLAYLQRTGTI
ncbi:hypothetical protein DRE_05092 [Drechslerella stenobrocha 248]|uniref:Uncharacterized protein n=1 Tax=Drechslerella stenobrocha 248 TaxID=1043628 RepID=W7I9P3_9PEZI|nr:hypothetical protein DRE_05092 [Drechslerella stenobrocha 248]